MPDKATLSPKQRRFLEALLISRSLAEACNLAGIDRKTGYRYLRDEKFQVALGRFEADVIGQIARRLLDGQTEALDKIQTLIRTGQSESVQLRAAVDWMTLSNRARELKIEEILADLEEEHLRNDDKHI